MHLSEAEVRKLQAQGVDIEIHGPKASPAKAVPRGTPPRDPTRINMRPTLKSDRPRQAMWIWGWRPTTYNEMHGHGANVHWAKGAKRKKSDRAMVEHEARMHGMREADCHRLVSLYVTLPKGVRFLDVDALWKSALDALKHAKLIVDDSPRFCTLGPVHYARSQDGSWGTLITLEDLL